MEFVFLKLTPYGILSLRHQVEFEKQTSSLVLAIKDDMNSATVFLLLSRPTVLCAIANERPGFDLIGFH